MLKSLFMTKSSNLHQSQSSGYGLPSERRILFVWLPQGLDRKSSLPVWNQWMCGMCNSTTCMHYCVNSVIVTLTVLIDIYLFTMVSWSHPFIVINSRHVTCVLECCLFDGAGVCISGGGLQWCTTTDMCLCVKFVCFHYNLTFNISIIL